MGIIPKCFSEKEDILDRVSRRRENSNIYIQISRQVEIRMERQLKMKQNGAS